jgi:hypothetical protein
VVLVQIKQNLKPERALKKQRRIGRTRSRKKDKTGIFPYVETIALGPI